MARPQVSIDVDNESGVWRVDGMPMILVPQHFLVNNHVAVERALGREVYAEHLQKAGYKSAYDWCAAEAARHGISGAEVFRHYMKRLSQRGWGQFQVLAVNSDDGLARVRVDHSVFVNQHRGEPERVCYMFEGWLVGALEYVAEAAGRSHVLRARETQCAADGEHGHCLFEVCPA